MEINLDTKCSDTKEKARAKATPFQSGKGGVGG